MAIKIKDIVKIDYEGRLEDGTVFDSSYKRGETISFPLGASLKVGQKACSWLAKVAKLN